METRHVRARSAAAVSGALLAVSGAGSVLAVDASGGNAGEPKTLSKLCSLPYVK
jgi:hypothetical protein